jgi:hypothetical protein
LAGVPVRRRVCERESNRGETESARNPFHGLTRTVE